MHSLEDTSRLMMQWLTMSERRSDACSTWADRDWTLANLLANSL